LESKGYVTHDEEGKVHRFAAAVQRQAAQKKRAQPLNQQAIQRLN